MIHKNTATDFPWQYFLTANIGFVILNIEKLKRNDFMVKHIILWKLKAESNTPEVKKGIKDGLEALLGVIDGLIEIKVHTNGLASSNADVMLYSVFESEEALKAYAVHPRHVEVADTKVRPFTAERSCLDFVE